MGCVPHLFLLAKGVRASFIFTRESSAEAGSAVCWGDEGEAQRVCHGLLGPGSRWFFRSFTKRASDKPRTAYRPPLEHGTMDQSNAEALQAIHRVLNPGALTRRINASRNQLINRAKMRAHSGMPNLASNLVEARRNFREHIDSRQGGVRDKSGAEPGVVRRVPRPRGALLTCVVPPAMDAAKAATMTGSAAPAYFPTKSSRAALTSAACVHNRPWGAPSIST